MVKPNMSRLGSLTLLACLSLPAYAISIEQAWLQAKQTDPTYAQAKIGSDLGDIGVTSTRSGLLPSLSAEATSTWYQDSDNTNSYGATLSQTLWDSSLWSDLDEAQANALKSRLELLQASNTLAGQLLAAYLDVASAQADLELAQNKLEESNKLLEIIEKRYQAGKVKSIDVEDIRATQVSERAGILENQSVLETKRAELAALINQWPETIDKVRTESRVRPPMQVESQQAWLALAKSSSPELLVAAQNVKAFEFAKQSAQGGYYPTVKGQLGYVDSSSSSSNGQFNAGLSLSVPIDLNGATRAKVEQASLNTLSAKQALRKVEIDIRKRVVSQFTQVDINWDQVLIADQLVTSRTKVLSSKETLYSSGLLEASEVIDAHNRLFEAKNNQQSSLYNYWRQRIALLQTAGKLDDEAITLISRAFHS
ncbi:TolC family protein [Vibrio ostreicida]|uniref:TolC family protein n=1 Tax=Vibrio ostreicida TaxID=526588 RepID=UPI0009706CEC|nr:TolC family protein [Vibrio ostreicida]